MFRQLNYNSEKNYLPRLSAERHPLSQPDSHADDNKSHTNSKTSSNNAVWAEPLSRLLEGSDPLSQLAAEEEATDNSRPYNAELHVKTWTSTVQAISSLSSDCSLVTVATSAAAARPQHQTSPQQQQQEKEEHPSWSLHVHAKCKWRLAQVQLLERRSFSAAAVEALVHTEVSAFMRHQRALLLTAWQDEQRVRSLKIVIMCCRLLESAASGSCYPAVFLQVAKVLDEFGRLVLARLLAKHKSTCPAAACSPTADHLADEVQQTTLNWLYKVACIKQLVPRLYVQMALLECRRLLYPRGGGGGCCGDNGAMSDEQFIDHLSASVHGVGHPLVSAYLRCYLARVIGTPSAVPLQDMMRLQPDNIAASHRHGRHHHLLLTVDGRPLVLPAVEWCVHNALAAHADASTHRRQLFERVLELCDAAHRPVLLLAFIRAVDAPQTIAAFALALTRVCVVTAERCLNEETASASKETENSGGLSDCLLTCLGRQLSAVSSFLSVTQRRSVLTVLWSAIQQMPTHAQYMRCAAACVGLASYHAKPRQLHRLLLNIGDHASAAECSWTHGETDQHTERIIYELLQRCNEKENNGGSCTSLAELLKLDSFSRLLDTIRDDSTRTQVLCRVVETLTQLTDGEDNQDAAPFLDTQLVSLGMQWCRRVHDSLGPLSGQQQRCQLSTAVCRLVSRATLVSHAGRRRSISPQQANNILQVLIDARQTFCRLQPVQRHVALLACHVATCCDHVAAACVAFCHVTALTVSEATVRVQLHSLAAQVALRGGRVSQAEAVMRAAIAELPQIPGALSSAACEMLANLAAQLVAFPDSRRPAELACLLLETARHSPALQDVTASGGAPLLVPLRLLSTLAQSRYDYRAAGADANDVLHGAAMAASLEPLAVQLVDWALTQLLPTPSDGGISNYSAATAAAQFALELLTYCDARWPVIDAAARRIYAACAQCAELPVQRLSLIRDRMQPREPA